jgi:hypothetical protein
VIEGWQKKQIASFYKSWIARIESIPNDGRALVLFQELSTAYVLGKNLPDIPSETGRARKPWVVAQQLMLNCL